MSRPVRSLPPQSRPFTLIIRNSLAHRSLLLMVGIMSFLACLTVGSVSCLWSAADSWKHNLLEEITIQILPTPGADIMSEIDKTITLLQDMPKIGQARVLSIEETKALLNPWLGQDTHIDAALLPRLIAVQLRAANSVDLEALRALLAQNITGAMLDDHTLWVKQLSTLAHLFVGVGLIILGLVMSVLVLGIVFATHSAVADNHKVISVLHFVGAEPRYISRQFQRYFGFQGLKGGCFGGILALCVFSGLYLFSLRLTQTHVQVTFLTNAFSVGITGYCGALLVIILIALLTSMTSYLCVDAYLRRIVQGGG